jgi:uncharacterized cupredoxin-like copper-binding protein
MTIQRFSQLRYPLIALAVIIGLVASHQYHRLHTSFTTATRSQTVTISSAGFLPNRITVHQGELVSLMIVNTDLKPHNLAIREMNVSSSELKPSQSTVLQFAARKKGDYPFISDVPGYPETGYQGLLVIE